MLTVHKMKLTGAQYLALLSMLPPALLPLFFSFRAMPSYNQDLNPFAGGKSDNNAPIEDPVFSPTLQAGMHSPFSAFLTKLFLVTRDGSSRLPGS
ncbi:unnamed protein product [Ectocarpus sp. 12 AP-2014]